MLNDPKLLFNAELHRYTYDGNVIPSVTQILVDGGLIDTSFYQQCHADRGTYVHDMIELYFQDDLLDEPKVPDEYQGYLEGVKKFVTDTGFKIEYAEQKVNHPSGLYVGRLDYIGWMNDNMHVLIDLKTAVARHPAWGIQLAAYAECVINEERFKDLRRVSLRISKDGKYTLDWYDDRMDIKVFMALLSIRNWKANNKLLKKRG